MIAARRLLRHPLSARAFRAAVCTELGEPLQVRDVGAQQPQELPPGHVRVRLKAAGLNFADVLAAQGQYQVKREPPFTVGFEGAGEVAEVAPNVSPRALQAGDPVVVWADDGCFAEEAVVPLASAFKLPRAPRDQAEWREAAALLVTYGTAHVGLSHRAHLQRGETVLVTAAAGGVGLAAVELAKRLGAGRVVALAGGPAKLAVAEGRGADVLIDYNAADAADVRAELKALGGVDVAFDMVGGDLFETIVRGLNWEGRAVCVGYAGGYIPAIKTNLLLLQSRSVLGLYWGDYRKHQPAVLHDAADEVARLWGAGEIQPHVCASFPLEEVNDAFHMLQSRRSTGKVVLDLC